MVCILNSNWWQSHFGRVGSCEKLCAMGFRILGFGRSFGIWDLDGISYVTIPFWALEKMSAMDFGIWKEFGDSGFGWNFLGGAFSNW